VITACAESETTPLRAASSRRRSARPGRARRRAPGPSAGRADVRRDRCRDRRGRSRRSASRCTRRSRAPARGNRCAARGPRSSRSTGGRVKFWTHGKNVRRPRTVSFESCERVPYAGSKTSNRAPPSSGVSYTRSPPWAVA